MSYPYDVVIVGGGPVGALTARLMAPFGLHIAVLEKQAQATLLTRSQRAFILSHRTFLLLEEQGLWPVIADRVVGVSEVQVSLQGHFGSTFYRAEEERIPFLGYSIAVCDFLQPLHQDLENYPNVDLFYDSVLDEDWEKKGALTIAADGGEAIPRQWRMFCEQESQEHEAFFSTMRVEKHKNIAFERFTQESVVALLPFQNSTTMTLVWSAKRAEIERLQALSLEQRMALLKDIIGDRVGTIEPLQPWVRVPLTIRSARTQIGPRRLLLGNGAHLLHPIAAQGFNLSVRDACSLVHRIGEAYQEGDDPGSFRVLRAYVQERLDDQEEIQKKTKEILYTMGHNRIAPSLKALGLTLSGCSELLRGRFSTMSLGSSL
jgi:2-octaprenyl-6-methoxyphenol hydroxylase